MVSPSHVRWSAPPAGALQPEGPKRMVITERPDGAKPPGITRLSRRLRNSAERLDSSAKSLYQPGLHPHQSGICPAT